MTAHPSDTDTAPQQTVRRSTRNVAIIEAVPETVYRAFLNPDIAAAWLAPGEMTARVHEFDAREGGEVRMSLTYPESDPNDPGDPSDPSGAALGKTAERTDTYRARFVELVPEQRVVQAITFETQDPDFMGEMRMTVTLAPTRQGTNITVDFDDIPVGIDLDDNRRGTASSLEKLSTLIGRRSC